MNQFFVCLIYLTVVMGQCQESAPSMDLTGKESNQISSKENVIAVGNAQIEKEKFYFQPTYFSPQVNFNTQDKLYVDEVYNIILADFSFYKERFESIDGRKTILDIGKVKEFGYPNYEQWDKDKIQYSLQISAIEGKQEHLFGLHLKLFKNQGKTTLLDRIFFYDKKINLRYFAHSLSDIIYKKIALKDSLFLSRLAFVSDKNSKGKNITKELYLMDYDGENVKQLTDHKGIIISPAPSFDGKKILYALLKSTDTSALGQIFLSDLEKGTITNIISRTEMITGAVFFPEGSKVALALNQKDSTNIFELDLISKGMRKITNHPSDNVDPSISQDGQLMAFLSGRSGPPMIYLSDPRGTELNVTRVSFQGRYNASPHFSPQGQEIVFSSWLDGRFDLFRLNRDGSGLVRLTKDFGSNEGARFSPDGEFLAFSSLRVVNARFAIQDIYIATRNGEIMARVTKNLGHCLTPTWVAPMNKLFED